MFPFDDFAMPGLDGDDLTVYPINYVPLCFTLFYLVCVCYIFLSRSMLSICPYFLEVDSPALGHPHDNTDAWHGEETWPVRNHIKAVVKFTPWPFRPKAYCRRLRLSICPSVRQLYLICTRTRHRCEMESPNLHQACIMGYSQLLLKMEIIDLDLQGNFGHFDSEF